MRGATELKAAGFRWDPISTRAPLAGRDAIVPPIFMEGEYFNPRAPCGARRLKTTFTSIMTVNFNPRAPCGARQDCVPYSFDKFLISTHAPLAGRDDHFMVGGVFSFYISTHAPLAGRDRSGEVVYYP